MPRYSDSNGNYLKVFSVFTCKNYIFVPFSSLSRLNESLSLSNTDFAIIDYERRNWKRIGKAINNLGGIVTTKIHCNLAVVISNQMEKIKNMQKNNPLLRKAEECNVHVVYNEFLLDVGQAVPKYNQVEFS